LALVAATSWDGGENVVRTLQGILGETAPFDSGELALLRPLGFERWTLTGEQEPIAAEDLLLPLSRGISCTRFDDVADALGFPRTQDLMVRQGLRSLLGVPLSTAGGAEGVLVIASRRGWAFAGTSLQALQTLVGMTGLALRGAIALTALRKRVDVLSEKVQALTIEGESLRHRASGADKEALASLRVAEEERAERRKAEALAAELRQSLSELTKKAGPTEPRTSRPRGRG